MPHPPTTSPPDDHLAGTRARQAGDSAQLTQLSVMAYGCAGRLGDGAALTAAVAAAVRRAGLTIVADIAHVYVPHGVTVAALLAQSHVVVSTWPEHRTAVVDMAVCGDSGCATRLWETLTPALLPDVVQLREHTIALLRPVDLESER